MSIDRRGQWWKGTTADDIAEYLAEYTAEGYPATEFRTARPVIIREGRIAHALSASAAIPVIFSPVLDGDTVLVDGGLTDNLPVRWLYIGCRCTACGILGCYADWKVAYSPSRHLLDLA